MLYVCICIAAAVEYFEIPSQPEVLECDCPDMNGSLVYQLRPESFLRLESTVTCCLPKNYMHYHAQNILGWLRARKRMGAIKLERYFHDIFEVINLLVTPQRKEYFFAEESYPSVFEHRDFPYRIFYAAASMVISNTDDTDFKIGFHHTSYGIVMIGMDMNRGSGGAYSMWLLRYSISKLPLVAYNADPVDMQRGAWIGLEGIVSETRCKYYTDSQKNVIFKMHDKGMDNCPRRVLTIYHCTNVNVQMLINRIQERKFLRERKAVQRQVYDSLAANKAGGDLAAMKPDECFNNGQRWRFSQWLDSKHDEYIHSAATQSTDVGYDEWLIAEYASLRERENKKWNYTLKPNLADMI